MLVSTNKKEPKNQNNFYGCLKNHINCRDGSSLFEIIFLGYFSLFSVSFVKYFEDFLVVTIEKCLVKTNYKRLMKEFRVFLTILIKFLLFGAGEKF